VDIGVAVTVEIADSRREPKGILVVMSEDRQTLQELGRRRPRISPSAPAKPGADMTAQASRLAARTILFRDDILTPGGS